VERGTLYHAMRRVLPQADLVTQYFSQQLLSHDERYGGQYLLYEHIMAGLMALRRLFSSSEDDTYTHVKALYFCLHWRVVETFDLYCSACLQLNRYGEGKGLPLVTSLHRGSLMTYLCFACNRLCVWHEKDNSCTANYCGACDRLYCLCCFEKKNPHKCVLCHNQYCLSHMLTPKICNSCMHPSKGRTSLPRGTDLLCLHMSHCQTSHHYERVFKCGACERVACEEHFSTGLRLCLDCIPPPFPSEMTRGKRRHRRGEDST
jgi:hypothetical protein